MIAVSCHRSLTAAHWQSLAHGITAIGTKEVALSRRRNRHGPEMYKDLTRYYKEFLAFVEEFVLVHPTPLRLYLWPALLVVESGLNEEKAILSERVSRNVSTVEASEVQQHLSISLQSRVLEGYSGRHQPVHQDSREDEDQLCELDRSIEALQRIKDTYFEDRDHLGHQEMLEGFEVELFGGLFDISEEAPGYVPSSHRKQSRSASISEFLTRKKKEIFATLGSSLSRAEGDLSKITEEEEEEEDMELTTASHYSAAMGSRGRAIGGKRSPRMHLRATENLSSDEDESSEDQRRQMRKSGSRARKLGVWVPREMSYEADTEASSPVQHISAPAGLLTVAVEVNKKRVSVSSDTSSFIEGSRKSTATSDAPSPRRRPNSSIDPPRLTPRMLSDTLLLPSSASPPPTARWPSDSHLPPEKPREPSPMLISQRVNANALSLDEAGSRRPFSLMRSNAVVEESPTTSPERHSSFLGAEVAMIESPTSGQRRPLRPGDGEREQRRPGSSLSQGRGEEQRLQRGEEQFSHALGLALQDLTEDTCV